ncbi:hypothetical protein [Albidovulum sediminis]|uniref:Uncharacterized protein n=1 Tax=Albidovulum sediminis TaxID=3066345 RepID=A0ABT2NL41_9RHOB|nr:hypothetical protein [Defluviimonas sediminis]MCT8328264.1 hypothetical protein [Defluviimonas sediminis]
MNQQARLANLSRPGLAWEDIACRLECAERLAEAIADAHPDDAAQLMTAALLDHAARSPVGDVFLNAEEDARWWASIAPPHQLVAVLAATLDALGSKALHLKMRKQLFLTLWKSFPTADRQNFVDYAAGQGRGATE